MLAKSATGPAWLGLVGLVLCLELPGQPRPSSPNAKTSFRFSPAAAVRPAAEVAPPLSLTASDGTGLGLVAFEARGVITDPLAFTELHLSFQNPADRTIEGRFRLTLPPGASISRFAMKTGDGWQEGEVVERRRAQRVYEDILHRRQDPALLEHAAGNEFSARVFPIPAGGVKELIVSYSHELVRTGDSYVIPLRGLPRIGALDIRVLASEGHTGEGGAEAAEPAEDRLFEMHEKRWLPQHDFVVPRRAKADAALGLRHGNLVALRLTPALASSPQEIDSLFVLVDSSASLALGFARQLALLRSLVAGLRDGAGGDTPVGVAAFDQRVSPIFEGAAGDFGRRHLRRIEDLGPLGASDVAAALGWLARHLRESPRRYRRVVLLSDGVATAGATAAGEVAAAAAAAAAAGVERLDVVATGGNRDEALLERLTTAGLSSAGQVVSGSAGLREIADRLTRRVYSGLEVTVEGAAWVWPQELDGIQDGDRVLVYADLPAATPLRVAVDGTVAAVAPRRLVAAERPLLERSWVKARIDALVARHDALPASAPPGDDPAALRQEIVELSLRHRVLSPFTALLVLETEEDYERYGIDRNALADILTVGSGGLEVVQRTADYRPPAIAWRDVPGELLGRVTDYQGTPLPGVRIVLSSGEETREELTDVDGSYRFVDLPPGRYDLEAQLDGFGTEFFEDLEVRGGRNEAREIKMSVAIAEYITVAVDLLAGSRQVEVGWPPQPDEPVGGPLAADPPDRIPWQDELEEDDDDEDDEDRSPYTGRFAEVKEKLARRRLGAAVRAAESWRREAPGDVLALLALGEARAARGELERAARAYGSLSDLFPARADLRRHAGQRLEHLATPAALQLALDTYGKALERRPDHPTSHRSYAYALLKAGRPEEAFETLVTALARREPELRFEDAEPTLREDLGLIAAAWIRREGGRRGEILRRLDQAEAKLEDAPSLRFVLHWETDANDVDLHVWDGHGDHAYYSKPSLPSGGRLYVDVVDGYGPECLTIRTPAGQRAYPYRVKVHYFDRGPMGYGMGTVQIIEHDGHGGLRFDERPFVVMVSEAFVDLGNLEGPLTARAVRSTIGW